MARSLRPLLAAVSSSMRHPHEASVAAGRRVMPFVTISREAGAGGRTLMNALVEHLRRSDRTEPAWAGYDRQLIDRVAVEHGIDGHRIEQLESDEPSWLLEVFEGIRLQGGLQPTDAQIYRKVVYTIRDLARRGHAVIVGRGAALATADMPAGVHVRLVAPLEQRIANLAEVHNMSKAHASAEVHRLDKARDRFFQRFWRIEHLTAEHFHLTLNTARLSEDQLVQTILAAMPQRQPTRQAVKA
jgi:cytidylate kinase